MRTVATRSGGHGSAVGAAPARWAVPGVGAVVAVSPHWPGPAAPGLSVAITALSIAIAGFLPATGLGRWFRFAWRRWTGLLGRSVADRELPVVLPATGSADPATHGAAVPIDVLVRAGRLLAVVELRPGSIAGRPAPRLGSLEPVLASAGVAVECIQWLQVSTHRRGGFPSGDGRTGTVNDRHGVSTERTLVVLRIDPGGNEPAINARGGGELGARRLVAVTVARAVSLLEPAGARPRLLDGAAALRAMSEVIGTSASVRRGARRRSQGRSIEFRDRVLLGGRQHRLWHWRGDFLVANHRRFLPPQALRGGTRRDVPAASRPAQVVRSSWIAAGPDGIRRGGAIRLSACSVAELEELERALRGQMLPDSGTLHDAVDDQGPLFAATLPYGGPR